MTSVRSPGLLETPSVSVRKSPVHGLGVFALKPLPGRRKIGEVGGRIVDARRALREIARSRRIYFVQLDERHGLDCSRGNALGRLNHSCRPNCYLRIVRHRVEVYSLRPIRRGEELVIDYGQTPHRKGMKCRCGSKDCKDII
ncbi:MAG TPA: SET domain-containing protein-lysine N-methyltransferase [candidate division Zixibacteria bacterium]|nr:SET domain-containing protein-lysine N-methyltransferase [candidate division Zixibacteria bacterium]